MIVRRRVVSARSTFIAGAAILPIMLAPADAQTLTPAASSGAPAATQTSAQTPAAVSPGASPAGSSDQGQTVIVTGTRETNKKARDSTSPIDIVTSASLLSTGQTNLTSALAIVNPSISLQAFGSDAGALTDAIRLRGLNPDQVLVLIDGKRRHTTASIYADSGPQEGTTPVDLDMIPMSMVDHIEVLRDGAAAQYGSDAIAGVVNIILKSSLSGSAQGETGATEQGDGWTGTLMVDKGAALGSDGFIHIGGDFIHADRTNRGLVDDRTGNLDDEVYGSPEQTREDLGINAMKPLFDDAIELYGNLTYAHRHDEAFENFRLPSLLPEVYPGGFSPLEVSEENDYATTLGIRGDGILGIHWDLSTTWGADHINIGQRDSANVSLFEATGFTPMTFRLQAYNQAQWTNNLDLTREVQVPLIYSPLHVAVGVEHRLENYTIYPGSPDSYYGSGTQALVGTSPLSAGDFYRDVYAAYGDLETHVTRGWDVDVAGRFEHYTDAGDTETGKIATRYDFNRRAAVRATISTGFRAPTLAEEHFSNLEVSPTGASGQLAVDSVAAHLLGAVPLKPERSTNISGGFVLEPIDRLHVTVDVYQINIRDRIIDGGSYGGTEAINALIAQGIQLQPGIDPTDVTAQYFSNGASTRTQGLDLTADYLSSFGPYGRVDWTVAMDLNRSTLDHLSDDTNGNPLLNAQGISYLTRATPRSKIILGAHWRLDRFDALVRETRWGQVTDELTYDSGPDAFSLTKFIPYTAKPRWLTDLELGYRIIQPLRFALGATDVFNTHPSRIPLAGSYLGVMPYDEFIQQIGQNGGFYYARLAYSF